MSTTYSTYIYFNSGLHVYRQNYMTYLIRYVFVACVLPLTDRGRLKYRFFSEKSDFFRSGRKNSAILMKNRTFTHPRMKPGNSGYGPGARKYRIKTGVYLLKRKGWQPWYMWDGQILFQNTSHIIIIIVIFNFICSKLIYLALKKRFFLNIPDTFCFSLRT